MCTSIEVRRTSIGGRPPIADVPQTGVVPDLVTPVFLLKKKKQNFQKLLFFLDYIVIHINYYHIENEHTGKLST